MKVKGLTVFLSGPMSDREDYHVADFALAHHRLKALGAARVYDPAVAWLRENPELSARKSHSDYMNDCIHELTKRVRPDEIRYEVWPMKYDLMVQLPGWEASDGATLEATVAHACGMPCVRLGECE